MFNLCLINQGQISTHKSTSGHMRVVQSDGGIILGGAEETKWKSKVQTKRWIVDKHRKDFEASPITLIMSTIHRKIS